MSLTTFAGPCWRAVAAEGEASALDGTVRAGRYNRPGERTLYMSASPEGVAAAMARYGDAPRALVALTVSAARLLDLRDAAACAALGIDASRVKEDWIAALDRGEEPPSWPVADRARALGAQGLIDGSRRAPGRGIWCCSGGTRMAARVWRGPRDNDDLVEARGSHFLRRRFSKIALLPERRSRDIYLRRLSSDHGNVDRRRLARHHRSSAVRDPLGTWPNTGKRVFHGGTGAICGLS